MTRIMTWYGWLGLLIFVSACLSGFFFLWWLGETAYEKIFPVNMIVGMICGAGGVLLMMEGRHDRRKS